MAAGGWKLVVLDNGCDRGTVKAAGAGGGLGTALVGALAKQLDAVISEVSNRSGLTVAITRSTAVADLPLAA